MKAFRNSIFAVCFMLIASQSFAQHQVNVIFDTDMGPDYDDVGAITLLHAFADSGKANILATIASTKYEGVAAVLSVLNTYFKKPSIPIAVPKGDAVTTRDVQHWTDTLIANYPHSVDSNANVPDAVELYRKILSSQPDKSVTIITVGFLTNIANLLRSGGDQISPLTGMQLIRQKVKRMVSMAGKFPEGQEFNIEEDAASARFAFDNLPCEVVFSGFEIGNKIITGMPLVHNESITNSPVKDVFRICTSMAAEDSAGRKSWDETAVLVGVAGHQPYYTLQAGRIVIAKDGSNKWDAKKQGHYYLKEKLSHARVQDVINVMMQHQPR